MQPKAEKTRAIIITDSDHVILSALQVETIMQRINDTKRTEDENP